MAQLTSFCYRYDTSTLHRIDTRYKFVVLCFFSIAALKAHFLSLGITTLLFFFILQRTGIRLLDALRELKLFILLLLIIFIIRSVTITGETFFTLAGIEVSYQGIEQGGLVASRFFIVMIEGLIFSSTTRPSSIKGAAQWFLKPIPFIPERRVAVMISLSIGFLPLIIKQANEISDAQKARCSNLQKNPLKKIYNLTIPLLKKAFQSADNRIHAMEARCYSENRTEPEFIQSGSEPLFMICGCALCALLILF